MMFRLMKPIILFAFCVLASGAAHADESALCRAGGGTYLTGKLTSGPTFRHGHRRDGVQLSHTHLTLLSDHDGQTWDIAVDNVFAGGYDSAGENVPAPLSKLHAGVRLELCGKPYTNSDVPGIDWVHTDCGEVPTRAQPEGWLKILAANGAPGVNLESSREYCGLWE
jgi:hypothetical protein